MKSKRKVKAKIYALPNNGRAVTNDELAAHLEEQAMWLRQPDSREVDNIMVICFNSDGTIHRTNCGLRMNSVEALGQLFRALMKQERSIVDS